MSRRHQCKLWTEDNLSFQIRRIVLLSGSILIDCQTDKMTNGWATSKMRSPETVGCYLSIQSVANRSYNDWKCQHCNLIKPEWWCCMHFFEILPQAKHLKVWTPNLKVTLDKIYLDRSWSLQMIFISYASSFTLTHTHGVSDKRSFKACKLVTLNQVVKLCTVLHISHIGGRWCWWDCSQKIRQTRRRHKLPLGSVQNFCKTPVCSKTCGYFESCENVVMTNKIFDR